MESGANFASSERKHCEKERPKYIPLGGYPAYAPVLACLVVSERTPICSGKSAAYRLENMVLHETTSGVSTTGGHTV